MPKLTLVRGLPGSGKSTYAESVCDSSITFIEKYEADQFFIQLEYPYAYNWSPKYLHEAHDLCRTRTIRGLYHNIDIIIANTFITKAQLQYYFDIANLIPNLQIEVVELHTQYKSIHNVPDETIERMKSRWYTLTDTDKSILQSFKAIT